MNLKNFKYMFKKRIIRRKTSIFEQKLAKNIKKTNINGEEYIAFPSALFENNDFVISLK